MKLLRLVSRIVLLSLAAAVFAGLTAIYNDSVRIPTPNPRVRFGHEHRPPAPQPGRFLEFVRAGLVLALIAVGGRTVLRLRLSAAPRRAEQPISLGLSGDGGPAQAEAPE